MTHWGLQTVRDRASKLEQRGIASLQFSLLSVQLEEHGHFRRYVGEI